MKSTPFTEMATVFRGQIVRLWVRRYPGTQSDAAVALTEAAINLGYVTRSRPVPGAALFSVLSKILNKAGDGLIQDVVRPLTNKTASRLGYRRHFPAALS